MSSFHFFFFQAEDGIRDADVTGVQTCALPISAPLARGETPGRGRGGVGFRLGRRPPSVISMACDCVPLEVAMIEARSLTKRYGSTVAVDGLSFDVRPGTVTGFFGLNGSGKSTIMRLIMGLDAPD